jgi:hypothetical protein
MMNTRILRSKKEDVIARIQRDNPGIDMIGEYLGTHHNTLFKCSFDHEWFAPPHRLLSFRRGCPECRIDPRKSTKESVNRHLLKDNRGIMLIGEYVSNNTKTLFRCNKGHEWMSLPRIVMFAAGCPLCVGWTREEINSKMHTDERDIEMIDEYIDAKTRVTFQCSFSHRWITTPANVLNGTGCPSCATHGFDISKPAHSYILRFDDFIKYGITNNLKTRLAQHRRAGNFTLIESRQYDTGREALDWELNIKRTHGGNYASRDQLPSGFTETLHTDKLNELVQTSLTTDTQHDTMIT